MKLAPFVLALAVSALSQAAEAKERSFGIGTAVGGGVGATSIRAGTLDASGVGGLILLPSLELRFFLSDLVSLDISSPLGNTIVIGAAGYGFAWRSDLNLTFNFGEDTVRFMAGPGLGATLITTSDDVGVGLILPGQFGVELLTDARGFGFQVSARPFLGFNLTGIGDYSVLAGGIMGVLGFVWYGT